MATHTKAMGQRKRDMAGSVEENSISACDLLPAYLRNELKSVDMRLISDATLCDPQETRAELKVQVPVDEIEKEAITVRCFSTTEYTSHQHTLLICNTINEIFVGESTLDLDAVRLFLQAVVLLFGKRALTTIRADNLLGQANMRLILDEINPHDAAAMEDLAGDSETRSCMEKMGLAEAANPQIVAMANCGAILLLAGKQLTEASVTTWTARRIRGLAASMGTTVEMSSVVPFDLKAAVRVYQKMSMLIPLRAQMVRILFGKTGTGSPVASLSAAMLNLLAWAEMNHIRMIQDYIFGRFPELLQMKQLQGLSTGVLRPAWDYLNTLDARERPYAKLLYSPQQTKALQRDHFVLLTDAAHAVGSYLHSSFAHYQGDTQGTAGTAIRKLVTEYLLSLQRSGHLVVQAAHYTTLDKRVVENLYKADQLFQSQLDDLDLDVKTIMRD